MSTRGAHSWVLRTPTGLPLWTSSVSSSPSRRSSRTIASNAAPDRGAPAAPRTTAPPPRRAPRAAVHDERVGILGHLGIEVVHEHPQERLLLPAATGELGATRG